MKTKLNILLVAGLLVAVAQVPLHAQLPNAWQITDSSSSGPSGAFYSTNLTGPWPTAALSDGWRYSINARMVDDFGGSMTMVFLYGVGTNRFSIFWDLDGDDNLTARPFGQSIIVLSTNGLGARLYHDHEIVYDPTNRMATYLFDGVAKATWSGDNVTSTSGQVAWGSGATLGLGQMNFHSINFLVGTNSLAAYDAGTENNPTNAPDPILQGWTVAPAAGALTNAVSPDLALLPVAMTSAADQFTTNSAVLNGLVDPGGSPTIAWFEWGTDTNYGNTTSVQSAGQGLSATNLNAALGGLSPGPDYHYRLVASNAFGLTTGSNQAFNLSFLQTPIPGLPDLQSGAVAWGDYDRDGRLDLLLTGNGAGYTAQIWRNTAGGFTNVTDTVAPGLPGVFNSSVAWGDYDNDGHLDFILSGMVTGLDAITQLWRNTGTGFTNVTDIEFPTIGPSLPVAYRHAAWCDYDNDGRLDLLFARAAGAFPGFQLWRNTEAGFSDVTGTVFPNLPDGVDYGVWGDYDNDGWNDLLLSGNSSNQLTSQVWRNSANGFTNVTDEVAPGLPGIRFSTAAWADFNNDGRLDFILTGNLSGGDNRISQIWQNTGNGFTNQTDTLIPDLQGISSADVGWADFDNDGQMDFSIRGIVNGDVPVHPLWRNQTNTFAVVPIPELFGIMFGSLAWGDCDNDGRIDVLLSGQNADFQAETRLEKNHVPIVNDAPTAPTALASSFSNGWTRLSWESATDVQTSAPGLSYNLRVGTSPGGGDMVSPQALTNGFRLLPALGNAQMRTNAVLDLPTGTYYWSVQGIDTAFAGGPFAPEASFVVPAPTLNIVASNLSAIISWQPDSPGFLLQGSPAVLPATWTNSPSLDTNPVVVPATEAAKFYRLVRTPPE